MRKKPQKFSELEIKTILHLKSSGMNVKRITIELNKKFNKNRTINTIYRKISNLESGFINEKKQEIYKLDEKLIEAIKNSPTNISYAIRKISKEYNVKYDRLENRYYKTLKHQNTILTVGSEIGFSQNNVKNQFVDKNGNLPDPGMNNIQWLLKNILNLSEQERKQLIQILNS